MIVRHSTVQHGALHFRLCVAIAQPFRDSVTRALLGGLYRIPPSAIAANQHTATSRPSLVLTLELYSPAYSSVSQSGLSSEVLSLAWSFLFHSCPSFD